VLASIQMVWSVLLHGRSSGSDPDMERYPIEPSKRRLVEAFIRVIDLVIYLAVIVGGIYALFYTPDSVRNELDGWHWLIPWWAGFLILGGVLGFFGRATTFWLLEPAACMAAGTGTFIYLIVLARTAFESVTAAVAVCLVIVAFLCITRRYFELQLFGSDPTHRDFRSKWVDAIQRRIPNVPYRG
jgi:hypothetical protein